MSVWLLASATALAAGPDEPTVAGAQAPGALASAAPAAGDRSAEAAQLEFRRVLVPHDRPAEWPTTDDTYLPVPQADFEQLVAQLADRPLASAELAATLRSAVYSARLTTEGVLAGEAQFEVEHRSPGIAMMRLGPCNLALEKLRWKDAEQPVVAGLTASGETIVLVERSGQLRCNWVRRATTVEAGRWDFSLELPTAAAIGVSCLVPDAREIATTTGLLTPGNEEGDDGRWWHVSLGPQRQLDLSIREARDRQATAASRVRQAIRYEVTNGGIEISADLEFESFRWPLDEFEFTSDAGFELLEVRMAGERADNVVAKPRLDGSVVYTVRGSARPAAHRKLIQVLGTARLDSRGPRPLPAIRTASGVWQAGKATLTIHAPLRLESVDLKSCRQTGMANLPPPVQGEAYEFEWFDSTAEVTASIVPAKPHWQAELASQLDINEGEVLGRTTLRLRATAGETFQIDAHVPVPWLIDSVEVMPPEAMADWTVETQGQVDSKLRVRLSRALRADEPLTLIVGGRRPRWNVDQPIRAAELAMLVLPADRHHGTIMRVRTAPPLRAEIDDVPDRLRIDPVDLTPAQRELIGGDYVGQLFAVGPETGDTTLVLRTGTPAMTAAIKVLASFGQGEIVERYEVACIPQRPRLRRVWIRLSHPRAAAVEWSLENEQSTPVAPRLISQDEQRGLGLPPGGEVWEVMLPRPMSAPFSLIGLRRSEVGVVAPVSLLSLPAAEQQTGRVEVQTHDALPLEIHAPRLRGLSLERPGQTLAPDIVAAYEYSPSVDADPTAAPAISLLSEQKSGLRWPRAVIRDCQMRSTLASDGTASHVVSYELELSGLEQLTLRLPGGVEPLVLWVDGQQQSPRSVSQDQLAIDLPVGARRTSLVLELKSIGSVARGLWSQLAAPMALPVDEDVRSVAPGWTIVLPSGLAATPNSTGWTTTGGGIAGWPERLFGSLARATARDISPAAGTHVEELRATTAESAAASPVIVAHLSKLRLLGWGGFWLIAGLTWLLRSSDRTALLTCGGLATLALTLPAPYWTLASPLWLGVLAGILAKHWLPKPKSTAREQAESSHRTIALSAAMRRLLLVSTICATALVARVMAVAGEPIDSKTPSVLIPARAGDEPTGDPYLVPESLWREMRRSAVDLARRPTGWLLANGQYRVALDWTRDGSRLRLAWALASYDLHVYSAAGRIVLPMADVQADDLWHVKLDGQQVASRLTDDGLSLEIAAPAPGVYRLEVEISQSKNGSGISWRVPPLPSAQLRIDAPADAPSIEFDSAIGHVKTTTGEQSAVAPMGGLDRLSVRWPDQARVNDVQAWPEIEQLTWVTLQPGAVVVQVRFRLAMPGGRQSIRIETADNLRPLPASDESRPLPEPERSGDARQVLTVPLVSASDGSAMAELNLLAEQASGIGQFAAPWIVPLQARVARRWLAVSVLGNLEVVETNTERYETAPQAEFTAAWGAASSPPLRTYLQQGPDESNWQISGRPRATQLLAQTSLTCEYGRRRAKLRFVAKAQATGGSLFRHELCVPPELQVESLIVTAGRAPRRAHWSLDPSGRLTVYLTAPLSGDHTISLDGTLSLPDAGDHALPVVRLAKAELQSAQVTVLRDPQVQVSVAPEQGLRETEPSGVVEQPPVSRVVADYEIQDPAYRARVTVSPNRPEISATTTTVLGRVNDAWHVAWEANYAVSGGTLDRVHIWIPKEVEEPLEIHPPAQHSIAAVPGEQRRLLTIVPRAPIVGQQKLELRARVSPRGTRRLVAPYLEATDAEVREQFLVLPGRIDGKAITWQTRGMARAEVPANNVSEVWQLAGALPLSHRVLANDFEATWQIAVDTGTPQVRIADYSITILPAGNFQGLVTFDLDPAERRFLPLTVPAGCEIMQTWVERVPGCLLADGPSQYRLMLHTVQLPQRVEVLFRGRLRPHDLWRRDFTLTAPAPGDLPVERTLWQVDAAGATAQPPSSSGQNLGPVAFELVRAGSLADVVETLCDVVPDRLEADQINAAAGWLERLRATLQRAQSVVADAAEVDREDVTAQLEIVQQAIDRLSARLPSDVVSGDLASTSDTTSAPASLASRTFDATAASAVDTPSAGSAPPLRAVFHGRRPTLDVRLLGPSLGEWFWSPLRGATALLLLAMALLSWRFVEQGRAWLLSRPAAIGAAIGLVWATYLVYPWMGVLLVVSCLVAWLYEGYRSWQQGGSSREHSSQKLSHTELA
ncbi:MAG: hypothetical protein AB7O68_04235 [Pirellulales bacterium]